MRIAEVQDVIICIKKSYMHHNFIPIEFWKTDNRIILTERNDNKYICTSVLFDKQGLKFVIEKENNKYNNSLVNAHNVKHEVECKIFNRFHEMEVEEGDYNNDKRREILENFIWHKPVLYKIGGSIYDDKDYQTVWATKNRFRTEHNKPQCMRFYFCINDCEHCQYYHQQYGCTNVESDHYGNFNKLKECKDFKEE